MSAQHSKKIKLIIGISEQEVAKIAQEMLKRGLFPVDHPAPPPKRKGLEHWSMD